MRNVHVFFKTNFKFVNVSFLQIILSRVILYIHGYALKLLKISLYVLTMFNLYFFCRKKNLLFSIHTFIRNLFLIRITCLTFHIINSVFIKLLLHIKSYDTKTSTPCATSNLSIFSCNFFFLFKNWLPLRFLCTVEST